MRHKSRQIVHKWIEKVKKQRGKVARGSADLVHGTFVYANDQQERVRPRWQATDDQISDASCQT